MTHRSRPNMQQLETWMDTCTRSADGTDGTIDHRNTPRSTAGACGSPLFCAYAQHWHPGASTHGLAFCPSRAQPLLCLLSIHPLTQASQHLHGSGAAARLPHPRRGPWTATRTCPLGSQTPDASRSSSDDIRAACPRPSGRAEDGQVGRVPAPAQRVALVVILPAM
jgi:hypothetical protein